MAINLNYLKTRVVRYPILAVAITAAIVVTGIDFKLSKADWSGWVQAIGACFGITIAIYVPAKQRQITATQDECRRADSARRVCMAFRDELGTLRENVQGTNVRHLLGLAEGAIFDRRVPIPRVRNPIFHAYVGRITEIDNNGARHGIIAAYDMINALIEAALLNNQLLSDYNAAYRMADQDATDFNKLQVEVLESGLRNMCHQMKSVARRSLKLIDEVLPLLEAEISRP